MRNMIRRHTVRRILAGWTAVILLTMSITASALAGETESACDESNVDAVDEIVCDHSYDEETASWTWAEQEGGYRATLTLTCTICGEAASISAEAVLTDEQAASETTEGWALYSASATIGDVTAEDSFLVTLSIAAASEEESEVAVDTSSEDGASDEENDESGDDEALEAAASYLVMEEVTVTEEAAAAAVAAETTEDAESEADAASDEETQTDSAETSIPEDAHEFNGHYYYVYSAVTWSEAAAYCESVGGYLATLTSAEENEDLFEYTRSLGKKSVYFGFTDEAEEGTWVWLNGEEVDYTNWMAGEANSQNSSEDYAMFYEKYNYSKWNDGDFGASTKKYYLCEWGDYEIDDEAAWNVDMSYELISSTNYTAVYEFTATFSNISSSITLENIFASLDPLENAELMENYGAVYQTIDTLRTGEECQFVWRIEIDRTAYADGGTYYYSYAYGAEHVTTKTYEDYIYLDAINGETNELNLNIDVWSFSNFGDESHVLTDDLYDAMMASLGTSAQEKIKEILSEGSDGHCYGMAVSVILQKMNEMDITVYTGTDTLREAERDTEYTHEIICFYQVQQCFPSYDNAATEYRNKTVKEQLLELEEAVLKVSEGGSPVLLCVDSNKGAHALVAYGWEEYSYTSPDTGNEYDYRILLYDCNEPDEIRYFYYDLITGAWEFPDYIFWYGFCSKNEDAVLEACLTDPGEMAWVNIESRYYQYYAELMIENETAVELSSETDSWTIYGKTGDVTGTSDITHYHIAAADEYGACGDRVVLLPSAEEEYTIMTASGEAEELNIGVKYEDRYISVEASAAAGVSFSADGVVTLLGNEGEFEIRIADDDVEDGEFDVYYISGDSEGDIVIELGEEDISVSADSISGMTIEAFEGDVEDSITITADVTNVVFGRSDDDELYCETHTAGDSVTENRSEATCVEDGSYDEVVYCVICGVEISRTTNVIAATGHNFVSGVCSVCGYRDNDDSNGTSNSSGTATDASSDTDSSDSSGSVLVSTDTSGAGDDETASAEGLTDGVMSEDLEQSDADLTGNAEDGGEALDAVRGEAATGDDSHVLLWLGLMMLSAVSLSAVIAGRRRRYR